MAILDAKKTADHISNWIKDYSDKAGLSSLVLGLSGGVDSALVALLCKRTGKQVWCINMPCHSSDSAYQRASNFARDYHLNLIKIDLSAAHESIYQQASQQGFGTDNKVAVGGLRSCLRAPTLSYFANSTRGLIVGTGNRSEDNITRYFQKYGDGCVDISPISDLFKNEVYELFAYLASFKYGYVAENTGHVCNVGEEHTNKLDPQFSSRFSTKHIDLSLMAPSARAIFEANPTADLWGPDAGQEDEKELGITYDEIEWADREDMRTATSVSQYKYGKLAGTVQYEGGIIFREEDPTKHPEFYRYTGRQQQVIARLHQLEKISRHKFNASLPCCKVRDIEGLVK